MAFASHVRFFVSSKQGALAAVVALALLFFLFTQAYFVAAHGGLDQNAYLVAGKNIARYGSPALSPADSDQFVGDMWVKAAGDGEKYYPKYPLGLPLLYAMTLKLLGPAAVYYVSPVCMSLALVAVFILVCRVCSSLAAILAVALLASSPVTLQLANNPNSHAAALLFVSVGMYLLFRYRERPSVALALAARFVLGYAAIIRYSEAMLILPIVLTLVLRSGQRSGVSGRASVSAPDSPTSPPPHRVFSAIVLLSAWTIPILVTLIYNRMSLGTWTAYEVSGESTAFEWNYFAQHWASAIRRLTVSGLVFVFPLALVGLIAMFFLNWRMTAIIAAWVVPNLVIYLAYYWGPDANDAGYLRFFLTSFPGWLIAMFYPLACLGKKGGMTLPLPVQRWSMAGWGVLIVLTVLAAAFSVYQTVPILRADCQDRASLQVRARQVLEHAPAGSVVFADEMDLLNHLQFVGDFRLYDSAIFNPLVIATMAESQHQGPQVHDPKRRRDIARRLGNLSQAELVAAQGRIVTDALAKRRRVFVVSDALENVARTMIRAYAPPDAFELGRYSSETNWSFFEIISRSHSPGSPP